MAVRRSARPRRPPVKPRRSTQKKPSPERPNVVIVGFGRMGGALALGLKRAGWPISVLPRSGASLRRAVSLGIPIADSLEEAGMCMLAVPDGAVATVAEQVLLELGLGTALVHCAGALDLSVFGGGPMVSRRPRGSFHPLAAVSDPEDPLDGHTVALSATGRPLMTVLKRMAEDLSLHAIEVPESKRAAYHAGAVLAAGGMVSLLASAVKAFEEAGIDEEDALRALLPLSRSALRGAEQRGLGPGLTGPVKRGDLAVVRAHLAALPEELGAIYRLLSLRAVELCSAHLPTETRTALDRLLRGRAR